MSAGVALFGGDRSARVYRGEHAQGVPSKKNGTRGKEFLKKKGRGPWLHLIEMETEVLSLLLDFMACRLFTWRRPEKAPERFQRT